MSRAQRRIARAQQDQVAVQHPGRIHLAARQYVRRPRQGVDRQQGVGGGGGRQFGIRCGSEETALVPPIDRLALERGDANAELSMS